MALQGTALNSREEARRTLPLRHWFSDCGLSMLVFSFSFFGCVGMPLNPGKQRLFWSQVTVEVSF